MSVNEDKSMVINSIVGGIVIVIVGLWLRSKASDFVGDWPEALSIGCFIFGIGSIGIGINKLRSGSIFQSHEVAAINEKLREWVSKGPTGESKVAISDGRLIANIGVETLNNVFTIVIKSNTLTPCEHKEIFSTASDNQEAIDLHVLQGTSLRAKENITLGKFRLEGFPKSHRGILQIEVTFCVLPDAEFVLKARDIEKGADVQVVRIGAKVANVFGYQRHIRPKLAERAQQEQDAQLREKELKDWLRSSFLEWKQGWLGKEFPHILQIVQQFKSPEDYVKAICENSYARNALGPIRNSTSFGPDEILLEISDRWLFTTHRLFIFTQRRLNPVILEHTIPLEDILSYERDIDTGQIVIHQRDGSVVSLICRHGVPRKDMMTRLIELRTARHKG